MPLDLHPHLVTRLAGSAGSVLAVKGYAIHSVAPHETIHAAVARLKALRIGALLVMRDTELLGVISERDYACKVILEGRASQTPVTEIMSSPVVSVAPDTSLTDCMRIMSERRIRHLPVIEAGRVIGVVSIGDLVRAVIAQQDEMINQLSTLIAGPYPA